MKVTCDECSRDYIEVEAIGDRVQIAITENSDTSCVHLRAASASWLADALRRLLDEMEAE